jgi:hypothetical protein
LIRSIHALHDPGKLNRVAGMFVAVSAEEAYFGNGF